MDHLILDDYKSFIKEKRELLKKIINTSLEDRVKVYVTVLDYFVEKDDLNEDEYNIFEIGYKLLGDNILTIELYSDKYFNGDVNALLKFDTYLEYSILVDEFKRDLLIKTGDEFITASFDKISKDIEQVFIDKEENKNIINNLNDISSDIYNKIDKEFVSYTYIFNEVALNLGLEDV